jgi:Flp pilus assembly protein TadD
VHLARGEAQEASVILERRVLHGPNDAYGRQLLAGAYHMLQREAEARVLASEGRGARPMFQDPWGGDILSRRVGRLPVLQRAHALLVKGKAGEAVRILEALRQAEPRDAAVLARLAFALLKQGDLEKALARAREATGLDPADSAAWLTQARVVHQRAAEGDDAEAVRLVDRALSAKPTSVDALTFRARLCLERGDERGALGAYLEARLQQPDNVTLLGKILTIQRRLQLWGDAVTTCESLLALAPGDQGARVELADDLKRAGDLVGAENLLRQALASQLLFADEDHPDTRKILLGLGDVLEAQGRDDDAYEVRRRIR